MAVRRTTPSRLLAGFWALLALLLILLRVGDVAPDRGLQNMASFVLVAAGVLVGLVWFVFRSGHPGRLRWGVLTAVVLMVVAATSLLRLEGFSSDLYPIFSWRWEERGALPTATVATVAVDLATTGPHDFPGFLGPGRDLEVEDVALGRDWQARRPQRLWSQPIGRGWSGFAVVNGWAATLEQRDRGEVVTLYEAATGRLVWTHLLDGRRYEHVMGGVGPRSTPTIHGGRIYVMSVFGRLVALNGADGAVVWERDLLADYGIDFDDELVDVAYGRPASPLVHEGKVIVPVGASGERPVSIAAFDLDSGDTIWEGGSRQISMASPALGTLAGIEQILVVNQDWVTGHDAQTGQELWSFPWPGITSADASVSQAVPLPPDRVFISKGYGAGAALWRLEPVAGGGLEPRELWSEARVLRTKLTNVALRDGYVYGLSEGILECVDLETGERAWKAGRYHHGQILLVDDVLLVLTEEGEMVMVEATHEEHRELGRFQALDGHTWNNFALYGELLLVRNGQEAAAWRLPLVRP